MKIYIASSWKNQHAVEMLTDLLRRQGHEVISFVEEAGGGREGLTFDDEKWIEGCEAELKFVYDTTGATKSDLVVYIGPSGQDAWAEVGAAWASRVPVLGLWSKGEQIGLMRKMVRWFFNHRDLLATVHEMGLEV